MGRGRVWHFPFSLAVITRGPVPAPSQTLLSSALSCLSYFTGNSLFVVFRVSCPAGRGSQEKVRACGLHFPVGPWEPGPSGARVPGSAVWQRAGPLHHKRGACELPIGYVRLSPLRGSPQLKVAPAWRNASTARSHQAQKCPLCIAIHVSTAERDREVRALPGLNCWTSLKTCHIPELCPASPMARASTLRSRERETQAAPPHPGEKL